jgi:hypothetical protein
MRSTFSNGIFERALSHIVTMLWSAIRYKTMFAIDFKHIVFLETVFRNTFPCILAHITCLGCVLAVSWVCLGCVLGASWVCLGASWVCLGCVLGVSWVCLGCVLGASWVCLGCVLGVSWVCLGCVLAASASSKQISEMILSNTLK